MLLGALQRSWLASPLWLDEAQTLAIAERPLPQLFEALRRDGAPPLYYVLLHGWLEVFGTSDVAARSFSTLASLLAIPVGWLMARRVTGSRRDATVFAVVLAVNPWVIRYSGEVRMYALVQLLVELGVLSAYLLIDRRGSRRGEAVGFTAVALVTAALLLTHYWALFLGAAAALWCLRRARRPGDRRVALLGLGALAAGALLFLPWLPTMLHQAAHTGAPWAATNDIGVIAALPVEWFGGQAPVGRTMALLVWPLVLLGVLGRRGGPGSVIVELKRREDNTARIIGGIALTALLLAYAVSAVSGGAVVPRYTAIVVPLALLLLTRGLRVLPGRYGMAALAVIAVAGLLAGLTVVRSTKSQSGEIATALNAQAQPGDLIVYCPDQLAPAISRQLEVDGLESLTRPTQRDPRLVDWTDYVERLEREPQMPILDAAARATEQGRAVWLVTIQGVYITHAVDCPSLSDALVDRLGTPRRVVEPVDDIFERAELLRFVPRP